jgi:hypothetical protein
MQSFGRIFGMISTPCFSPEVRIPSDMKGDIFEISMGLVQVSTIEGLNFSEISESFGQPKITLWGMLMSAISHAAGQRTRQHARIQDFQQQINGYKRKPQQARNAVADLQVQLQGAMKQASTTDPCQSSFEMRRVLPLPSASLLHMRSAETSRIITDALQHDWRRHEVLDRWEKSLPPLTLIGP